MVNQPARFYPIVPDLDWVRRIAPLGIKTVQLRLKDAEKDVIRNQVVKSLEICKQHDVQLIVNDYWDIALETGANYIHLGQEDLAALPEGALHKLKKAGIKLGISTHSPEELAIAQSASPDYVALGPIYETILKKMKWAPQGLDRIAEWKDKINCPLVAIGGLTPERATLALEAGADSVAVVTDFLTHETPEHRIKKWINHLNDKSI